MNALYTEVNPKTLQNTNFLVLFCNTWVEYAMQNDKQNAKRAGPVSLNAFVVCLCAHRETVRKTDDHPDNQRIGY